MATISNASVVGMAGQAIIRRAKAVGSSSYNRYIYTSRLPEEIVAKKA